MKTTIFILAGIIFLEYIVYNTVNGNTIPQDEELHLLEKYRLQYTKANLLLKEQLLDRTSYTSITATAAAQGYIFNDTPIILHHK